MLHNGIRGKIIYMIRSMYSEVKSRVKYLGRPSEDFHSYLGVRQGESLSPFLFCLYVNDLKETLVDRGIEGVSIDDFRLCLLLYADDSIIISSNKEELQSSLDILHDYCEKWHLYVNVQKTKIVVFRKGGRLSMNDFWFYGDFFNRSSGFFSIFEIVIHWKIIMCTTRFSQQRSESNVRLT